ncbi:hypothetical protein O1611_g744 [Lasiodiplodia mahajangana]|uniref:Uncharacterized protein n=1 Tax=Lasiodiplodia mahajangana TaxID=1108764 RepID=A0ACC2K081_9PEZI|nr:hypothetical protein O1611_g744 [Lasiodiplodia mahajangana]
MSYSVLRQSSPIQEVILHRVVIPEAIGNKGGADGPLDKVTDPTSVPMEREAPVLRIPRTTIAPTIQKRQDDGQIQALSAQLQSATEAISSVSLSASSALSQMSQSAQSARQSADQASQSLRQSADQAVQSANQAADQANRQLSQTQSSASSAVSAANSRASDQLSQSLASMSSRISANLASAQSSASDAVSSARAAASQFAASQIQAFQADASGVRGVTSSPMQQAQSSSISTSTFAIIITVAIIGTAILTVISSCLFLRYRRKKRFSRRAGPFESNEKSFEKPIAVRGSLGSPSPRFGRSSRSRMDSFRLPSLSPLLQSKKAQREARKNIGFASSEYSGEEEEAGMTKQVANDMDNKLNDADDTQPSIFRLQKSNGVSSATTVRLIRVGSDNRKSISSMNAPKSITEPMPPPPAVIAPDQTPKTALIFTPNQPSTSTQSLLQPNAIIAQPPKAKETPPEERRVSSRSVRSNDTETPGWRPPMRLTAASANRFTFRDSSDMESNAPTPTNPSTMPQPNTYRPSLATSRQSSMLPGRASGSGGAYLNRMTSTGRPKNGAGTFATFPRTRTEPPRESMTRDSVKRESRRPRRYTKERRGKEAAGAS